MSRKLLEEMVKCQENRLLLTALQIVPNLTFEDILQPQDFPELEESCNFRYEEGVLVGLKNALAALRAEQSCLS